MQIPLAIFAEQKSLARPMTEASGRAIKPRPERSVASGFILRKQNANPPGIFCTAKKPCTPHDRSAREGHKIQKRFGPGQTEQPITRIMVMPGFPDPFETALYNCWPHADCALQSLVTKPQEEPPSQSGQILNCVATHHINPE